MIKKAYEIFNNYKQIKGAANYTSGLRPIYEAINKELPDSPDLTIDLGCAYGIMSLVCKLRGDAVLACDMTDKFTNLKMLQDNGIPFEKFNIEKDTVKDKGEASLVIFTEILEHLNSSPLSSIKKIYDLLKPGGYVVCSTPAKELWGETAKMNADMGKKPGLWNDKETWKDIPEYKGKWKDEHTYHYDQFDIVSLFTEAGFEVQDVKIIANFSHLLIGKKCVSP